MEVVCNSQIYLSFISNLFDKQLTDTRARYSLRASEKGTKFDFSGLLRPVASQKLAEVSEVLPASIIRTTD